MARGNVFVVRTNLDPKMVNAMAMVLFAKWVDFAMGHSVLNGKRLVYPTGRYASSIHYQREGDSAVAIIADEDIAPEAAFIEYGHGPVDLKQKLTPGKAYRMHRPPGVDLPMNLRRVGAGPPSMKPTMWAEIRMRERSGFASFSENSPADSWIIPTMPAYSPAMILAIQAKQMLQG